RIMTLSWGLFMPSLFWKRRFAAFFLVLSLFAAAQNPELSIQLPKLNPFIPTFVYRSLDPCDDFYNVASCNFITANPIPSDQASWNTASNLTLCNQGVLHNTMMEASKPDPQRTPVQQKVADLWDAFMDESGIEAKGMKGIKAELDFVTAIKSNDKLPGLVRP